MFIKQRQLTTRSERVKCVDFHPTEPWMLTSLYDGTVAIWNYETEVNILHFFFFFFFFFFFRKSIIIIIIIV